MPLLGSWASVAFFLFFLWIHRYFGFVRHTICNIALIPSHWNSILFRIISFNLRLWLWCHGRERAGVCRIKIGDTLTHRLLRTTPCQCRTPLSVERHVCVRHWNTGYEGVKRSCFCLVRETCVGRKRWTTYTVQVQILILRGVGTARKKKRHGIYKYFIYIRSICTVSLRWAWTVGQEGSEARLALLQWSIHSLASSVAILSARPWRHERTKNSKNSKNRTNTYIQCDITCGRTALALDLTRYIIQLLKVCRQGKIGTNRSRTLLKLVHRLNTPA